MFDHLKMIKTPDEWPAWPYLPIKRRDPNGGWPDCRLLWIGAPNRVVEANLFALPKTKEEFLALPYTQYDSPEAIVADGWIVD